MKIAELQNGSFNGKNSSRNRENLSKMKSVQLPDTKCLQAQITPPPDDIKIDPNETSDPVVQKIIVS